MKNNLTRRKTHFEFGENWISFLNRISDARIAAAVCGLERLFPDGELRGKRFLDIGCGSGLSMLAALKLGAREAIGVDIDENSVEATHRCMERFAPGEAWGAEQLSVFELDGARGMGRFDVVYSWGVLHHTGDMWRAVDAAAAMVGDGGMFAIALYRKTKFCGFWRREKYFYSHLPRLLQLPVRWLYQGAFLMGKMMLRKNPVVFVRDYGNRGMSWTHDVHDWLGGYPYQSASPEEVHRYLSSAGFRVVRERVCHTSGRGLFGSGCDEYVFARER